MVPAEKFWLTALLSVSGALPSSVRVFVAETVSRSAACTPRTRALPVVTPTDSVSSAVPEVTPVRLSAVPGTSRTNPKLWPGAVRVVAPVPVPKVVRLRVFSAVSPATTNPLPAVMVRFEVLVRVPNTSRV